MIKHLTSSSLIFSATACALLLLTACAQPKTLVPKASLSEIEDEKSKQVKIAHGSASADYSKFSYSKSEVKRYTKRLQKITDKLVSESTGLCVEIHGPDHDCNMYIQIDKSAKGINAYSDGKKIVVHPALVDFTKSDTHLAFVLAHEYAHHMMEHVGYAKQNVIAGALLGGMVDVLAASQGVSTGGNLSSIGAHAGALAYSPEFEHEADYIALYMLERAGYNISKAPQFWREMSKNNPDGIYNRTTHPTTPERYVVMQKAIKEIRDKKRRKQPLRPNMVVEN